MKTTLLFFPILLLLIIACNSNDDDQALFDLNQQQERETLNRQLAELNELATDTECTDADDWTYKLVGSKACGGHTSAIPYNKTLNNDQLFELADQYTEDENAYNIKWNVISDCAIEPVPVGVNCVDGKAVLNYSNDIFAFGHFYGFCQGEQCIETFYLMQGKLYEDTIDVNPLSQDPQQLGLVELSPQHTQLGEDLFMMLPTELMAQQDTTFGIPDAADGGGLFIMYRNNGIQKRWLIDQMKENVPAYLHSFMDKTKQTIQAINQ